MDDKNQIIVVGAGKGLGNHIAERFGREGFRVILIARNEASLADYKREFKQKGIETAVYVADAARPDTLTDAFSAIQKAYGTPDVLVYNVGVTALDAPGAVDSPLLMERYQMDVASAYHCVQQLDMEEFGKHHGSILFTGGGLALNPHAAYTPLSLDKAALRAMAYILHDSLMEYGVYVGTVTVCGGIQPGTDTAPERIAEAYYSLYKTRAECEYLYQGQG